MKKPLKKKWYVEHAQKLNSSSNTWQWGLVAFKSFLEPVLAFPYDGAGKRRGPCVGPFKTKRAALWAEKYGYLNPHFQHVNDAERIAKQG